MHLLLIEIPQVIVIKGWTEILWRVVIIIGNMLVYSLSATLLQVLIDWMCRTSLQDALCYLNICLSSFPFAAAGFSHGSRSLWEVVSFNTRFLHDLWWYVWHLRVLRILVEVRDVFFIVDICSVCQPRLHVLFMRHVVLWVSYASKLLHIYLLLFLWGWSFVATRRHHIV